MKRYIYTAVAALLCLGGAALWLQHREIVRLTGERNRYRANTDALMSRVQVYMTRDSLHAAKVSALELTIAEYRRYRAADAATIASLKTRARDLEAVTSVQAATIIDLRAQMRDSVRADDARGVVDTLKCIDVGDEWFTLAGCFDARGDFSGTFESVDSLLVVQTVRYRRFLGFLWKTRKVKDREVDVVNRNPYIRIANVEAILIKK